MMRWNVLVHRIATEHRYPFHDSKRVASIRVLKDIKSAKVYHYYGAASRMDKVNAKIAKVIYFA